jgi:hypothetical protein
MPNDNLSDAAAGFRSAVELFEKGRLKAAHKAGSDSYDVWIAVGLINLGSAMQELAEGLAQTHAKLEQVEGLLRRSGS